MQTFILCFCSLFARLFICFSIVFIIVYPIAGFFLFFFCVVRFILIVLCLENCCFYRIAFFCFCFFYFHIHNSTNNRELQPRYGQRYENIPASPLSQLRDIPQVSGQVIWCRELKQQMDQHVRRVEAVLGPQ